MVPDMVPPGSRGLDAHFDTKLSMPTLKCLALLGHSSGYQTSKGLWPTKLFLNSNVSFAHVFLNCTE